VSGANDRALLRAMPAVFVLVWSTGFVVARYGMPHAPPLKFLSLRYALSLLCFGAWVALSRPAWPKTRAQWLHLAVCGVLDRKSTRLNSSHQIISYAVFCLKKKKKNNTKGP